MEPLKELAEELKQKGYEVYAWMDEKYNSYDRRTDYTRIVYTKNGRDIAGVGYDSFDDIHFSREYVPATGTGSSCSMDDVLDWSKTVLEMAEDALSLPIPSFVKGCTSYGSMNGFLKTYSFYHRV